MKILELTAWVAGLKPACSWCVNLWCLVRKTYRVERVERRDDPCSSGGREYHLKCLFVIPHLPIAAGTLEKIKCRNTRASYKKVQKDRWHQKSAYKMDVGVILWSVEWVIEVLILWFNTSKTSLCKVSLSACLQLDLLWGTKQCCLRWGKSLCWESELKPVSHSTCASEQMKMPFWKNQSSCIYYLGSECVKKEEVVSLAL